MTGFSKIRARKGRAGLFGGMKPSCLAIAGIALFFCCNANATLQYPAQHPPTQSSSPPGLQNLLRQAKQALLQGQPSVALIYLKNAADLAPQNAEVHAELGAVLLNTGDLPSAERELRTASHLGAPEARTLPFLLGAMLGRGEYSQVLGQFQPPTTSNSQNSASIILRARAAAYERTGQDAAAVAALDQALTLSRSPENLSSRAQFAFRHGDFKLAAKLADEALSKTPNDFQALVLKISLLQIEHQAQNAVGFANDLVKYYPGNPNALLARAGVLLDVGQDAKAGADIDKVMGDHPNLAIAIYYKAVLKEKKRDTQGAWQLAQTLPAQFQSSSVKIGLAIGEMAVAAGHVETGAAIITAIVNKFPTDQVARIRLAALYLQLKDAQRAREILAPLQDSQDSRVMVLFAELNAMQGQFKEAADYLKKAGVSGTGGPALQWQIAAMNLRNGNFETGVEGLQTLSAKNPANLQIAGLLVAALTQRGDLAGAQQVVAKLVEASPKSPYGPLFQGQLLAAGGDLDGAQAAFSRSLALDPKFTPAIYAMAVANADRGAYAAANVGLEDLITANPKNVPAYVKSAEIAAKLGNFATALKFLQQAVAANPKDTAANLALAKFLVSAHRMNDALIVTSKYLAAVPGNFGIRSVQGEILLAMGRLDQAAATFGALLKDYPRSAEIWTLQARLLAAKKDKVGAVVAFQKAIALAPNLPLPRAALVQFEFAIGDTTAALAAAQSYATQSPGPQADELLAGTFRSLKQNDKAKDVLVRSYSIHPSAGVAVALSQLLRAEGAASQADSFLADWLTKNPNDDRVRLEYAQECISKNPEIAEAQLLIVLKREPYNLVALNNAAWLLREKDPKHALEYGQRAMKLAPNSAEVLDTLADINLILKDQASALPVLERAHRLKPSDAEITYHLAIALRGTGHNAEAKQTLSNLIASNQVFEDRTSALSVLGQWK